MAIVVQNVIIPYDTNSSLSPCTFCYIFLFFTVRIRCHLHFGCSLSKISVNFVGWTAKKTHTSAMSWNKLESLSHFERKINVHLGTTNASHQQNEMERTVIKTGNAFQRLVSKPTIDRMREKEKTPLCSMYTYVDSNPSCGFEWLVYDAFQAYIDTWEPIGWHTNADTARNNQQKTELID